MYGSALAGGNPGCAGFGCGTIFELSPAGSGWVDHTLYAFTDGTDGANPQSGVVADGVGNLYSATGGSDGALGGTVFELSPAAGSWTFHLITDLPGQGVGPWNSLIRDSAGNLYGTTVGDGAYGQGNVFKLTTHGQWLGLYQSARLHRRCRWRKCRRRTGDGQQWQPLRHNLRRRPAKLRFLWRRV